MRTPFSGPLGEPTPWSFASKAMLIYGAAMWLACGITGLLSLDDARTLRDVGIWVKPMKFMAATALWVWTTVWLGQWGHASVAHGKAYPKICTLIVLTSLFEVVYISYQASQGAASHYNNSDALHRFMFALMGLAALGLTASQGWLAWAIWSARRPTGLSVTTWGILLGLTLTFVLSTVSGFMLGGHQPPAGQGLPGFGWHLYKDIRPAHFLGVHAQQLIPLWGLIAERCFGRYGLPALCAGTGLYVVAWGALSGVGLGL